MTTPKLWVVRAGIDNILIDKFEKRGIIAIGWSKLGDLSKFRDKDSMEDRLVREYSPGTPGVAVGMLWRFSHEMSLGDFVLTPIKSTREVLVGKITGEYFHDSSVDKLYPNLRKVSWEQRKLKRSDLPLDFRNALGSTLTLFALNDYLETLQAVLSGKPLPSEPVDEDDETRTTFSLYEETRRRSLEMITDILDGLDPYAFQNLVAAVIGTLGYKTRSSPKGRDKGVDVLAQADVFGFKNPVIKVQVKHRNGETGRADIAQLLGVLKKDECGLFVSSGGFKQTAHDEASTTDKKIQLMDQDAFIELMVENYERLSPEFQAMIPLKKLYIPIRA